MLEPQTSQRRRERRARLRVRAPELRQTGCQPLRIVERDERPLEARPPQEPHCGGVEPFGVAAGDQSQQRSGFVEVDVTELGGRGARGKQVAAGNGTAKAGERGSLRRHEQTFVSHQRPIP